MPKSKHIAWWSKLSHKDKWNMTVNYIKHYEKLTDEEIKHIYDNRLTWFTYSHIAN